MSDRVEARLAAAGMSGPAAAEAVRLFARAADALDALPGGAAGHRAGLFVPGRIEVFGKHTDYAGGRSLLCAIERGICLVFAARSDGRVQIVDAAGGLSATFEVAPDLAAPLGDWSNYPMTAARRLARSFPAARRGADVAFASNLPAAAGLSSSSALLTATFLVLARVNALAEDETYRRHLSRREELAGFLGSIENGAAYGPFAGDRGVGTFGGSEDHTAILCAEPGALQQYAFCPVRHERRVPVPPGIVFVVGFSGIAADKTGGAREKYNRASREAADIVRLWNGSTGRADETLAGILHAGPDAVDRLRDLLRRGDAEGEGGGRLAGRLEHFLLENEHLLPAAAAALEADDLEAFGRLARESQEAAERLLGNQVPETVALVEEARAAGAIAASAFGAGFGGSVWALVHAAGAGAFADDWSRRYRVRFPGPAARAIFLLTPAGPPATWV